MNEKRTPDEKIEEIFHRALELGPEPREAFLAAACDGDVALRQEVETLLEACREADDGALLDTHDLNLLEGGVVREVAEQMDSEHRATGPVEEKPGDEIGNFRLLQRIGEGGFGVVWMAEQRQPLRRRVALKIVKLGMDTKQVVARFEQERQALAMMDHPNIARVFDAGATPQGRPYFVMELVRGQRITDFCDEEKLPTAEPTTRGNPRMYRGRSPVSQRLFSQEYAPDGCKRPRIHPVSLTGHGGVGQREAWSQELDPVPTLVSGVDAVVGADYDCASGPVRDHRVLLGTGASRAGTRDLLRDHERDGLRGLRGGRGHQGLRPAVRAQPRRRLPRAAGRQSD